MDPIVYSIAELNHFKREPSQSQCSPDRGADMSKNAAQLGIADETVLSIVFEQAIPFPSKPVLMCLSCTRLPMIQLSQPISMTNNWTGVLIACLI